MISLAQLQSQKVEFSWCISDHCRRDAAVIDTQRNPETYWPVFDNATGMSTQGALNVTITCSTQGAPSVIDYRATQVTPQSCQTRGWQSGVQSAGTQLQFAGAVA